MATAAGASAATCGLCAEEFAADQAMTTLLCQHEFHTECILREAVRNEILGLRCHVCSERIIPNDMLRDVNDDEDGTNDIVSYFWDNEPAFKADVFKFKTLQKKQTASAKILKEKVAIIKEKLDTEIQPLLAPIEAKVAEAKAAFKALPELKVARRDISARQNHNKSFREKWELSFYSVRRILADKPDFKGFGNARGFFGWFRMRRFTNPSQFDIVVK